MDLLIYFALSEGDEPFYNFFSWPNKKYPVIICIYFALSEGVQHTGEVWKGEEGQVDRPDCGQN